MLIPAGEGRCKAFVAPELLIPAGSGATGYTCCVQTHMNTEAGTVKVSDTDPLTMALGRCFDLSELVLSVVNDASTICTH